VRTQEESRHPGATSSTEVTLQSRGESQMLCIRIFRDCSAQVFLATVSPHVKTLSAMTSLNPQTRWQVFPRFKRTTPKLSEVVDAFIKNESRFVETKKIKKKTKQVYYSLESNEVVQLVRKELEQAGFRVEKSKKQADKIKLAVTYKENDAFGKTFEVDAYHIDERIIIEVEAGRAVSNNAAYLDFLKGCALQGVAHIVIAVRLEYKSTADFDKVRETFDTIYASSRLQFPVDSLLLIGYPVIAASSVGGSSPVNSPGTK
jgi:hypothetical protein